MTTAHVSGVATRFLEALAHRDYEGLAATFEPDGRLRGLVPTALREAEGREAIAERFRIWNDDEGWGLLESDVDELADVVRLRWRVAAVDPDEGPTIVEQTAYAGIGEGGISWMNLVCSGSRRAS